MNLFNYDIGRKCLIAEGWCPQNSTERIINAMRTATESSGALVPSILSVVKSKEEPPSFFRTNKFTRVFQTIVDAYGVPRYGEINPAVFTIITFPFLFGVMFGDVGHGLLMTMFAAYLILNENKLAKVKLNEMIETCYKGRYIIILMGVFAIYNGFIYNECFGVAINMFGSNWKFVNGTGYRIHDDRVYEFGVDPAWNGATNSLNYYNSLKMKLSLIFGVAQMSAGIWLSLMNYVHFRKWVDIFGVFIPQIIFLWALFGYMDFLIFWKWAHVWEGQPPFILNVMIDMFLQVPKLSDADKLFGAQQIVQWICLALAFVAVPWMLLTKPLVLRSIAKSKKGYMVVNDDEQGQSHASHGGHGDGEFDFGEEMVLQIIHTIEFVLGAISNTASYLRLWALSLAHSELSAVFWEKVMLEIGYEFGKNSLGLQIVFLFVAFGAWAGVTFGVLLCMESLSAFLHALRLHWVEFQNKFYQGDGHAFVPFSYERIMQGSEE